MCIVMEEHMRLLRPRGTKVNTDLPYVAFDIHKKLVASACTREDARDLAVAQGVFSPLVVPAWVVPAWLGRDAS